MDNDAIAYLSDVLLSLRQCGLSSVDMRLKRDWSTNSQAWHRLDEALCTLGEDMRLAVYVGITEDTEAVQTPSLPFSCMHELCIEMLSRGAAQERLLFWCDDNRCHICSPHPVQETLQDLLPVLTARTRPLKSWDITIRSALLEDLGSRVQEMWRVWEEISRIYSLSTSSLAFSKTSAMNVHVDGMGKLLLYVAQGELVNQ